MAYIKTLKNNELVGGTDETDVYPITHTKAIFDSNNKELEQRLAENEEKLSKLETEVIYDVTANNNGVNFASLSELLSNDNLSTLIPINVRCGGMSIRFIQSSDNKYVQYRLTASIWSTNIYDWAYEDPYFIDKIMQKVNEAIDEHTPIEIHGDVSNAPDEEDLTSVNVGGTDVLKFKDKAYNPLTYSGMGRKILRKNIVNGVNTLTQSMINKNNTIYVIQYDFTLIENISVPADCVLEFNGGSISGDNIKKIYLNNTVKVSNGKFTNILIYCVSVSNILVENCVFENTSNEEIHVFHIDSVNDLNIFKCKFIFDGRTITCTYIRRSSNINISNNTFACTPFDIYQDTTYIPSAISFGGNCEHVEILENDISYFGIGVSFTSDLSNTIKNVKIINNLIHHCTVYGINLYENGYIIDGAIVKGNSIHDISGTFLNSAISNQKTMGAGIYLLTTDNVICSNNNIYNVALQTTNEESLAPAGIGINGSNHISCIGNIIHHTGKQGIINGGDNNIIDGNIIYNTGTYGIDFRFGENVVISNNTLHDVTDHGIFVRTKTIYPTKNSSIIIEGNSINTSYFGIHATNVDAILQITNNKIYNFTLRGLYVANYNNATISENVINSSQPNSIALYVGENSVVSISNNTLKGISSSISVEPTAIVKENSNTLVSENWSSDSLITHKVLTVPSESPYIANNPIFNNNFNMYTINGTGTIAGLKNVPPRSLVGLYINSTNLILKDNATNVPYRFRLMSGDETITSTSFILFYANINGHLYVVYKGPAS